MGQRIKKTFTGILLSAILLGCIGCGKTSGGADGTGRYSEETIALPAQFTGVAMAQEGDTIRLLDEHGADLLSTDGGKNFVQQEVIPEAKNAGKDTEVRGLAGTVDGTRIFKVTYFGKSTWKIITGENERIFLEEPETEYGFWPHSFYEKGSFYTFNNKKIYKTDVDAKETVPFAETAFYMVYVAASNQVLYAVTEGGTQLLDPDTGERLEKQDEVLDKFLAGEGLEFQGENGYPVLLCPFRDGLYVLTHGGLYWHTLYGDTMELVLDSGMYGSISDDGRDFLGMAVTEEGDRDAFLVLYSDGSLVRYAFDTSLSRELDLRVYSVYEDVNVARAVKAYREAHPEKTVAYEVGYKGGYGLTLKDVLNNLSTEIAAGTGPDILVMDAIPFRAYADKGALMDLSFLRDTMTEDTYFTSVVDGFATEGEIYAMPMTFVVPVIGTYTEWMEQLRETETLSDLADLLEEAKGEFQDVQVTGFLQAEHTLSQLSQASMGAWMDEDGGINREAVTEFLTQAKRIYEVAMREAPEGSENWYTDWPLEYLDANIITRTFGQGVERPFLLLEGNEVFTYDRPIPFYTDYLRENYGQINGYLEHFGGDLALLPGQEYGSCLPATVLSVNRGTSHEETSREFMEFVFSGEFQGNTELFGFPVSRYAYKLKQIDTRPEEERAWLGTLYDQIQGQIYEYDWPSAEAFKRLDSLLDQVTHVNICDSQVYETVLRLGQGALKGETTVEETVDAIEKELQIYLAE